MLLQLVITAFFYTLSLLNSFQPDIKPVLTNSACITLSDSLDLKLTQFNDEKTLPGFAVSVFNEDSIYLQKGYGFMNSNDEVPFESDAVQIIASVTKTFVGVGVMKLVEQGKLKLDDSINDILPYAVVNPLYPETDITIRMLAAHTSSIGSTKNSDKGYRFEQPLRIESFPAAYQPLLSIYNCTEDISMNDFLKNKLSAQGKWYTNEVFTSNRPGTSYEYSNLGIALLARIVEIKSGQSFSDYTHELILQPLGMKSSYWNLENIPTNKHVTYYNELHNAIPKYHIITYPDGGLYSSVNDMTLFLQEMIKGYHGKSAILSKQSFQIMMSKQFMGKGLDDGICWDLSFDGLIGHSGNDFGTATLMYFSPSTDIGRILFTNISIETEEQENIFYGIFNTLFEYDFKV